LTTKNLHLESVAEDRRFCVYFDRLTAEIDQVLERREWEERRGMRRGEENYVCSTMHGQRG
jgi:hypothetical protein